MSNEAKVLTGIGIATLAIVVGAVFFFGGKPSPTQDAETLSAEQVKKLVTEDSHQIGDEKAQVTIVEFGDYQCPACGAAHPIVTKILEDYKGKVKFVFRHFPLPSHKNARAAAMAAEAAGSQDKFFEMHGLLYENQAEWSESNNPIDEYFVTYAEELKLDPEKFKAALSNKTYEAIIQQGVTDGTTVGVTATPTFFINEEKITGGLPYEEFKAKIDTALSASQ